MGLKKSQQTYALLTFDDTKVKRGKKRIFQKEKNVGYRLSAVISAQRQKKQRKLSHGIDALSYLFNLMIYTKLL